MVGESGPEPWPFEGTIIASEPMDDRTVRLTVRAPDGEVRTFLYVRPLPPSEGGK